MLSYLASEEMNKVTARHMESPHQFLLKYIVLKNGDVVFVNQVMRVFSF